MAIGHIWILFCILLIVSIISIALLFGVKDTQGNIIIFAGTVLLGILISYISMTSLPSNYLVPRFIAGTIGFLSFVGVVLRFTKKVFPAKLLVTASIVFGIIQLFFF